MFNTHYGWLVTSTFQTLIGKNHQVMAGATRARQSEVMLEICHKYNLEQIQLEPTRVTQTTANVLDLFFTSNASLINSISVTPGFGDHFAVLADSSLKPEVHKKPPRKIFQYGKAKMAELKSDLDAFVNTSLGDFNSSTVEENWVSFKTELFDKMDKYIPSKMSSTRRNVPWFNRDLHKMRRKQQRLYNSAKTSGNPRLWEKFREHRKNYNKALRQAENNHIRNLFSQEDNKDNNKAFYKYIKNLRRDNSGISPLKVDGKTISDPQGKANVLSDYFRSVFTDEPSSVPTMSEEKLPSITPLAFNTNGILKLLDGLNASKASGPDNIPVRILKECAVQIAPFLQALFTQSLQTGELPVDWQTAFITPLFKKGDRSQPSNHRPVSLTSVCCKIMEHCIFSHIMSHCENHTILTDVQHGFRRKRSCESQLIETVDDLAFNIDQGLQTDIVVLDFRKAFDTVPHLRLLSKLEQLGIDGPVHNWINTFLTSRIQKVVVDGAESQAEKVTSGVPQGTVLGPLLFLLYINDLPQSIRSQVRLFADDCLIYHTVKTQADQNILQEDLHHLESWQQKWLMQFNPTKCTVIHMTSSRRKPRTFDYFLCNQKLSTVDCNPYLGVEIARTLSWNNHINNIVKLANSVIVMGLVKRNLYSALKETKILAYQSIVRPTIEYAASIWDPFTTKNISKVEKIQRSAARFVHNDYSHSSVTSMLENLEWTTLQTRRKAARLTILFKIRNGDLCVSAAEKRLTSTKSTRIHQARYKHLSAKMDTFKNSYFPRTIVDWNALPPVVIEATTTNQFKERLKPIWTINSSIYF